MNNDRYPTYIEALDQIEVLEKALELMYEKHKKDSGPENYIYHISKEEYINHIKTKAKEMMKSE